MGRLRALDRFVLIVFVPIWVCALLAFVRELAHGGPRVAPFLVLGAEDANSLPVFQRAHAGSEAATGALRTGDRLLRVAGVEVRGRGAFAVHSRALAGAQGDGRVPLIIVRDGRQLAVEMRLVRHSAPWRMIPAALAFAGVAVLLVLRAPRSRLAQAFLISGLVISYPWLDFYGGSTLQSELYFWSRSAAGYVWAPLALRPLLRLPGMRPSRRVELLVWSFALLGPTWTSMWFGFPFSFEFGARANATLAVLLVATSLGLISRLYAAGSALVRRQIRWLLLGLYSAGLPVAATSLLAAFRPELGWLSDWSRVGFVAIPICVFIAVRRAGLLDVDRLISRAASLTLLVALPVASALSFVPALAAFLVGPSGSARSLAQVALTATCALALLGVDRRLQRRVELPWHAADGIAARLEGLKSEYAQLPTALALLRRTGDGLHDILALESCVVLSRAGDSFSPVLRRGSAVAPSFPRDSQLMSSFAKHASALRLDPGSRALQSLGASEAERATLLGSGAAVSLPVARGGELLAFALLGPKRNGDVFTPPELAQLAALASALAGELERVGGLELLREAQELEQRMRQFVPGSVARRLQQGGELVPAEREVSVLFIDIEGYTRLTEQLSPEAVFSLVNRYTETVSDVVVRCGGSVVEFNGDGMMAVFGAPDPLPAKEHAAVTAALELVGCMARLDPVAPGEAIRVGVGVATGAAYVGALRSVDRFIWSAIGRTTNLAARLQQLTRELGASIAIDRATRDAAGEIANAFSERAGVVVRGFREEQDLYLGMAREPRG